MTREEIIATYGPILSEHGQWWVTEKAVVAHEDDYEIVRDHVGAMREGTRLSEWVLQVGAKPWCRPRQLVEALVAALSAYGVKTTIDWAGTRDKLERQAYLACCHAEADRLLGLADRPVWFSEAIESSELTTNLFHEYWDPSREWKTG